MCRPEGPAAVPLGKDQCVEKMLSSIPTEIESGFALGDADRGQHGCIIIIS